MISPATGIGAATLLLAGVLIWLNVKTWWTTSGKPLAVLLPGLQGTLAGSSFALCTGGLFGSVAALVAGATNSASGIIPWTTGTQDQSVASGTTSGLTIWGGGIAFAIIITYSLALKALASSKSPQDRTRLWRLAGGGVVGICLTYTAGVATVVDRYEIPTFNWLGELLIRGVETLGTAVGVA